MMCHALSRKRGIRLRRIADLGQVVMEVHIICLVVLEKLKVDFRRAQPLDASGALINNKSWNHNIRGLYFNCWNHTMRFDIAPKTFIKGLAELEEFPLHICNLVEYIHTYWVFFSLGISRFVVQQDQIRNRHRTPSLTAPATSTRFKSEHADFSRSK